MNGMNKVDSNLLADARPASGPNRGGGPDPDAASAEASRLASAKSGGSEGGDIVRISGQAKERLREYEVIKLETPPHITSVKEYVQELAKKLLQPHYESEDEQRELAEASAVLLAELGAAKRAGQPAEPAAEPEDGTDKPLADSAAKVEPASDTVPEVNAALGRATQRTL